MPMVKVKRHRDMIMTNIWRMALQEDDSEKPSSSKGFRKNL